MIHERPAREPLDAIIIAATVMLAGVLALGIGFGFWRVLEHTVEPRLLTAGAAAVGIGVGLIGFSLASALKRLFLTILGPVFTVVCLFSTAIFGSISH